MSRWSLLFSPVGKLISVHSYDTTGRTTESTGGMFDDAASMGSWEAYFAAIYQKVDKKMLDEDRKRYQGLSLSRLTSLVAEVLFLGSEEEKRDLYEAYTTHQGSLPQIMAHIPHCTTADEERFIALINEAIRAGDLDEHAEWKTTSGDQKARKERVRKEKKEAKEAEAAAKEMGVWEEFYGDKSEGAVKEEAKGKRGTKRKPASTTNGGEEEDVSALAALIGKRQQSRASAFDALLDKYSVPQGDKELGRGKKGKGGKRGKKGAEEEEPEMPVSWPTGVKR